MMPWKNTYVTSEDGTALFVRTAGDGAPLLMIHGAACDSAFLEETGLLLSERFRVILYDRRGYGHSGDDLSAPESAQAYFSMQAADAARLLSVLVPGCPAAVLGCSCGSFTAAYLAAEHPELTRCVLLHEPPLYGLLPSDVDSAEALERIASAIQKGQYERALHRFLMFLNDSAAAAGTKPLSSVAAATFDRNGQNFIRREFSHVFDCRLPLPAVYPIGSQVLLGEETSDRVLGTVVRLLAKQLALPLHIVPGGHNAARDIPKQFCAALLCCLEEGGFTL